MSEVAASEEIEMQTWMTLIESRESMKEISHENSFFENYAPRHIATDLISSY